MIGVIAAFIFIAIVHEAGHWMAFRYYKKKPQFKVKWWGIQIGHNVKGLTLRQHFMVSSFGVFAGYIALFLFIWIDDYFTLFIAYLLACVIDFFSMYSIHLTVSQLSKVMPRKKALDTPVEKISYHVED